MIALFQQIERLLPHCQGWCSLEKAHALATTVLALRPALSVEIGVFGGKSLLPIALAHKFIGKGEVIGIDPWSAAISAIDQPQEHKEWWGKLDHEAIYQDFSRKVQELDLGSVVRVWKKKSDDVKPPEVIDLLHLDGNHCAQALLDARRFAPNVRIGGILCLDDISGEKTPDEWKKGVNDAAAYCEGIGFVELYEIDTSAFFQRVK